MYPLAAEEFYRDLLKLIFTVPGGGGAIERVCVYGKRVKERPLRYSLTDI